MNKLAIVFAISGAALLGGSAANAADKPGKLKASIDVRQLSTDISSQGRHHRHYRHRNHYGSYAYYAPRRAYYAPPAYYVEPYGGYGYGGPVISLGFGGGGGFGGGHRHHHGGW